MVVLYPVTVFFSAALLFLVEPMVGKLLLPSLGGSPELGALAADAGLTCREEEAKVTPAEAARHYAQSTWVLMARHESDLGRVAGDRRWRGCPEASAARVWTDDYSSLLSFLKIG